MLSVSAMVHKICEQNDDCHQKPVITEFVNFLQQNIGSDCSFSTPEQKEEILVTLKSIGNAGNTMTSSAVIGRCINNEDLDEEIRVAALQAFRRLPCSASVSHL